MWTLFKKKETNAETKELFVIKGKTTNQIIEEIHETFYTEVDRLLVEANIKKEITTDKEKIISRAKRLKNLGFNSVEDVDIAEKEKIRLLDLKNENNKKDSLKETINYFSFKYPLYKFITEESVKKICEKYNLVYGDVSKYKGDVPEKNLKEIENFKIKDEDICCHSFQTHSSPWSSNSKLNLRYFGLTEMKSIEKDINNRSGMDWYFQSMHGFRSTLEKCSLEICAPLKDFNMKDHEVKDFKISKIEIPDPVVLQPVVYKGEKHYLIVSAWGLEAEDDLVLNNIVN